MAERDVERVIQKIQKLLALAARAGEGEQAAALAQADRLMAEYDIAREQVEGVQAEELYTTRVLDRLRGIDSFANGAKEVLLACFHVRLNHNEKTHEVFIFGLPHHIALAVHAWVFLTRAFRDKFHEARQKRPDLDRRAYVLGLAGRVIDTIQAGRRGTGLMVRDDRLQQAYHFAFAGCADKRTRGAIDPRGFCAGYNDGQDIQLYTPLRDKRPAGPVRKIGQMHHRGTERE